MKSGGATKVADTQTVVLEKKGRKSLHPLQPAATNKENLVGAGRKLRSSSSGKDAIKNSMAGEMKKDVKTTAEKTAQTLKTEPVKKVIQKPKNSPKKNSKDGKKNIKIFKDKAVQRKHDERLEITSNDLTSNAEPSENYWKILAERRRIALQDALEENQILSEQLKVYKEMLNESRALVEVLKDMIGEDRNDIDNSLDDSRS
ncbi:uncharacterized protein LOC106643479 [Copidosoma floridanum]|uniref:uncharacterized protein LOC106643479 n=1 Tax=Copidosoma floridanum TaxID=29053 RepID=UPI0006C942CC|nr:uncharacterized protein LOC106643479 [Copidosoma floridanum]XP_014214122.1 uncharacterized protein LOC106643479 [Copidosoma floridanum]